MSNDYPNVVIDVTNKSPNINIGVSKVKPDIEITIDRGGSEHHEYYDGPYEVESKLEETQILPTKNKAMKEDLVVDEIPVFKTGNPSGGYTYYIGR